MAAAYCRLQHLTEAHEALRQAIAIAAPDQLIMPFVENGEELLVLFRELEKEEPYAPFIVNIKGMHAVLVPKLAAIRAVLSDALASLTSREREVAELVADGMSNKAIAQTLFIEESTVKKTLQNTYAKLGINGRTMLTCLLLKKPD